MPVYNYLLHFQLFTDIAFVKTESGAEKRELFSVVQSKCHQKIEELFSVMQSNVSFQLRRELFSVVQSHLKKKGHRLTVSSGLCKRTPTSLRTILQQAFARHPPHYEQSL